MRNKTWDMEAKTWREDRDSGGKDKIKHGHRHATFFFGA